MSINRPGDKYHDNVPRGRVRRATYEEVLETLKRLTNIAEIELNLTRPDIIKKAKEIIAQAELKED